ncbi:MAG: ABC transporter ATP-binding protein, partial [Acetivibrio ethanolgignens]
YRRNHLGFVFQDFNLLDTFTAKDNILLPLVLNGKDPHYMEVTLKPLSKRLGIAEILNKFPYEISGGEKQRVALARAMISQPKLLLADEPTGALDSKSSDEVLQLFEDFNSTGQTILMVTHSTKAASHAGRVLFIKDGTIYHQLYRENRSEEEMYEAISDTLTLLMSGGKKNE